MIQSLQHRHGEAFMLMKYQADDGSESEIVWNSRDGVTPFVITLRSGKQARHVEWRNDVYHPEHKPVPGDRIFVDLTMARAEELALANARRYFEDAELAAIARERWATPEEMAKEMAVEAFGDGHAPDLIEVK